jgi:DNA polymerase-3 subunit delta
MVDSLIKGARGWRETAIINGVITIIYSNEPRLAKGGLKKVLKTEFPERDDMNYVSLDMAVTPITALAEECEYIPLGYDKKAVVAENCFFLQPRSGSQKLLKGDKPEALIEYLQNPNPEVYLYLLVYSDTIDEKGEIAKAVKAAGAVYSPVSSFTEQQWYSFIPRYFEKRGSSIDRPAVQELIERIGGSYGAFLNEAAKLLAYSYDTHRITVDDVRALVPAPLEDNAFRVSDALTKGDNRSAIAIYHDLTKSKSFDEVSFIILLANQFRFLNQVNHLSQHGRSDREIASNLKASQARVSFSRRTASRLGALTIRRALEGLYETEKSILTGKVGKELALELFLAEFTI